MGLKPPSSPDDYVIPSGTCVMTSEQMRRKKQRQGSQNDEAVPFVSDDFPASSEALMRSTIT